MEPGTEYSGGTLENPIVHISDGIERIYVRDGYRWKRSCWSDAEYQELTTSLVNVDITSEGFERIEE